MYQKQLTRKDLAKILNVHVNTVDNKLHKKTDWALPEILKIRAYLNSDLSLQELFKWEGGGKDEAE